MRRALARARLVIAGDGSRATALDSADRRARPGDRCAAGRPHGRCRAGFHHAFDLFVQSSDYEGTPNAVLEAMAFETPIVATAAGGTAELVRDGDRWPHRSDRTGSTC